MRSLQTFVVSKNVFHVSIDFEDYSAISIDFYILLWCFWAIYWLWRLCRYFYWLLHTFMMFLSHLLTLKTMPLFLLTFVYFYDDFEDYSAISVGLGFDFEVCLLTFYSLLWHFWPICSLLKTIPLYLFTFVYFYDVFDPSIDFEDHSDVSIDFVYTFLDPSIDFEDYSAISIDFCILLWCFWSIYWICRPLYSLLCTLYILFWWFWSIYWLLCVYFSDVSGLWTHHWLREVGLTIRTVSACPKAVPLESLQTWLELAQRGWLDHQNGVFLP
jgi:hypothetical protein